MPDVRLIDANVLMKNIGKIPQLRGITYGRMKKAVEETPTDDAVPVVRCRECKYRGYDACPMCHDEYTYDEDDGGDYFTVDNTTDDGFCHMGAKMDGGAERPRLNMTLYKSHLMRIWQRLCITIT